MAGGDNRYGFLNLNSRADRAKANEGLIRQGEKDAKALEWAKANPTDPRSAGILDDVARRYAN